MAAVIAEDRCILCGECAACCPVDCIELDYTGGGGGGLGDPQSYFNENSFQSIWQNWEGSPFLLGGENPSGTDCSGLIWGIYNDMGLHYDRCSTSGFSNSPNWEQVDSLEQGDIIVWPGEHSVLYFPNGQYDCFSAMVSNGAGWACSSWFSEYGSPVYYRYKP